MTNIYSALDSPSIMVEMY